MYKNHSLIVFFILLTCLPTGYVWAQNSNSPLKFWNLQSINGFLSLESQFRNRETVFKNEREEHFNTKAFSGQIEFNTRSYIWHPKFMLVDIGAGYSPGLRRDQFLVAPNRSESNSLEKLNARVTFFNQKPLSLGVFTRFDHSFISRDFATNIEMIRSSAGGMISFRNTILPVQVNYLYDRWRQLEIRSGREFANKSKRFTAEFKKSFGSLDRGRLVYSYEDYKRQYSWSSRVRNIITSLIFKEDIFFDHDRKNLVNTNIRLYHQVGTQILDRLQAYGNVKYHFPLNFIVNANYRYFNTSNIITKSDQNDFLASLEHQLYKSLHSNVYLESNIVDHSDYQQERISFGMNFRYQKKIPFGNLHLFYEYRKRGEEWENKNQEIRIIDEQHVLNETGIVLLDLPYVILSTVIVTDESNSLVYVENIDYILLSRGNYTEIQRLPGGQIESGGTVFIDYTARQASGSRYENDNFNYGGGLTLFSNLLEFYVHRSENSFENVAMTDFRILKAFDQTVIGGRISVWNINAGLEYDDFQSNIIPYKSNRFFISISGMAWDKFNYTFIGNLQNITLVADLQKQKFWDVSGKFTYSFNSKNKITLDGAYRQQRGRALDLDLFSMRSEFITTYRQIKFAVGAEMFKRLYINEKVKYNSIYVRIERRF